MDNSLSEIKPMDKNSHLEEYIENGADIEAKDDYGRTPLIRASANGCVKVVKILIENGADIEAKNNAGYDFTRYLTKVDQDEINKFIETGCFNFTVKPAKK